MPNPLLKTVMWMNSDFEFQVKPIWEQSTGKIVFGDVKTHTLVVTRDGPPTVPNPSILLTCSK